jgi:hypothetical protein
MSMKPHESIRMGRCRRSSNKEVKTLGLIKICLKINRYKDNKSLEVRFNYNLKINWKVRILF